MRHQYVIKFGLLDSELMRRMRERLFAGADEFGGRIVREPSLKHHPTSAAALHAALY